MAEKKISMYHFTCRFDTYENAMHCIEERRLAEGRTQRRCGSGRTRHALHEIMAYWCSDCRMYISVKSGMLKEGSSIGCDKWLVEMHWLETSLKGVSSTKLASEIIVALKSARFLVYRIRVARARAGISSLSMQATQRLAF